MRTPRSIPFLIFLFAIGCKNTGDTDTDPDPDTDTDTDTTIPTDCIQVDGSGDFTLLSEALAVAVTGSVITLCDSLLTESVAIDKDLSLIGLGQDTSTGLWPSRIHPQSSLDRAPAITILPDVSVTMSGLEVTSSHHAIQVGSGGSLVLEDAHLSALRGAGVSAVQADLEISGTTIDDAFLGGVVMDGGLLTLTESVLQNTGHYGLSIEHGAVATLTGNTISDSRLGAVSAVDSTIDVDGDTWTTNPRGLVVLSGTGSMANTTVSGSTRYAVFGEDAVLTLTHTDLLADPASSYHEDASSVLNGGYGVVVLVGELNITGGEISGHNGGGIYVYGTAEQDVPVQVDGAIIRDNAARGVQAFYADLSFTDVVVSETRNDDPLCVVDDNFHCNWAVGVFYSDLQWTGGTLADSEGWGLIVLEASAVVDGLTLSDNEHASVYAADATLTVTNSTARGSGNTAFALQAGAVATLDSVAFVDRSYAFVFSSESNGDMVEDRVFYLATDVVVFDAAVTLTNSSFSNGESGVFASGSSDVTISDTSFAGYSQSGVETWGGTTLVERTSFDGLGSHALSCGNGAVLQATQSTITDTTERPFLSEHYVNGVLGNTIAYTRSAPAVEATGCTLSLTEVTIDGSYSAPFRATDSVLDLDQLTVRDVSTTATADLPAVSLIYDNTAPDLLGSDIEITGVVDGPGMKIASTHSDPPVHAQIDGLSIGLDDGYGASGTEGAGLALSGISGITVVGLDIASTGDVGIDAADTVLTLTGVDPQSTGTAGTISATGSHGIRAVESDLTLSDLTMTAIGASGLSFRGGTQSLTDVSVSATQWGMQCTTTAITLQYLPADGETLTLDDSTTSVVFEFDDRGNGVTSGHIGIDASSGDTVIVAEILATAISDSALAATAHVVANRSTLLLDPTTPLVATDGTAGDLLLVGFDTTVFFDTCANNTMTGSLGARDGCDTCAQ